MIPKQVWIDLEYEIARHDLEYADNYRAYRVHDRQGFDDFVKRDSQGCCGFYESSTVVDGDKWIIGCNHGH